MEFCAQDPGTSGIDTLPRPPPLRMEPGCPSFKERKADDGRRGSSQSLSRQSLLAGLERAWDRALCYVDLACHRCVSETKVPIPWVSESCGSNKGTTPDHPLALIDTRVKPLSFQGGKLSQGAREGQASVHSLAIGAQYVRIALWWESIPRTEFRIGALQPPHDARAIKAMAEHSGPRMPR